MYNDNGRPQGNMNNDNDVAGDARILFSSCKSESHTHKTGFKQLYRRVRASGYKPDKLESKEDFTTDFLRDAAVLVLGCPRERFTASEFEVLKRFVHSGGSLLVLLNEGGEEKAGTNINYLLEEFGISVNNDAVVRTTHYKYLHPKEVLIADGVLNRAVLTAVGKVLGQKNDDDDDYRSSKPVTAYDGTGLDFVYPYGSTLSVQKPAIPILSSGKIAYPMNRPLGALWHQNGSGKIAVVGSVAMFDDKWIDKEENSKVMDFLLKWLRPGVLLPLNAIDAEEPEVSDLKLLPDTQSLAEKLKGCLQEGEDIPRDWTTMFDTNLFRFDTSLIPEAVALYDKLALFDLDETFASEASRLAYLTNKCYGEADLEYYIVEAGHILGLKLPEEADAKSVLSELFRRISAYKMVGSLGLSAQLEPTMTSQQHFDQFEL
ncbi:MAG: hypothetical protein WDW38_004741 [Sanguina aurantia]